MVEKAGSGGAAPDLELSPCYGGPGTTDGFSPARGRKPRPAGSPVVEDQIVPQTVGMVLGAIGEEDFVEEGIGYRISKENATVWRAAGREERPPRRLGGTVRGPCIMARPDTGASQACQSGVAALLRHRTPPDGCFLGSGGGYLPRAISVAVRHSLRSFWRRLPELKVPTPNACLIIER